MGVRKQAGLVLLACLVCAVQAGAQHSSFQFYGPELGLTNQNVIALHQDRNGFLWVGTEGGLFRYDGDRFQPFAIETQRKKGIVYGLHSSSDGQLWAGSSAGLFRWSGDRFAIEPGFKNVELESAQALASDADSLYVAAQSGVRILPLRGTARARVFSSRRSYSVMVAADHTVWYGCDASLCSMAGGRMTEWGTDRGVTNGPWRYIAEDVSGRIWIRSMTRVLVKEPGATVFHEMPKLRGLDSTRGWQVITTRSGAALIPHNSGLTVCSGGDCWQHGQESGLRHAEVFAVLMDREGSLWLGYSGHGLARRLGRDQWESFAEQEGLGDLAIWRIVRDRSGDLWVGTTHGLFHGSQVAGRWRFKRVTEIGDLTIYAMDAAPDGSLWLGVYQTKVNGLIRFNPKTHATRIYAPPPGWPQLSVKAVFRDEGGTVWVATSQGLLRLPPGAVELEHYPTPLDGATVYDIRSTPQGLFAGGRKGLYIENGQMRRLLTTAEGLRDNIIQSVYPRPDGSVWVDYFSPNGISRLDFAGKSLQMQHLSTADGLPSDIIYAQFFDARGRHWVTTDNGAAVLEGGHWVHYDTSNGLVWNDCNTHSFLTEANGSVWIGTSGGVAHYRPVALRDAVLPATLVTSVLRNDQPAQSMDFDAQTRALGLRFTMLSYLNQNPRFRYRIGGSPSPWSQTTGHEVRLAELAPGTYDFVVQGEASPGVWSSPASVHFQIRAPWYLTRSCQVVFAALIAACFWLWWRNREQRQARVREKLEQAVTERTSALAEATRRAEQANRVKGEFVANISHEMRTPLNGVLGLTQLALELTKDAEVAEHLRIAQFSARGLLSLINDVLDFSKLEAGEMQILPGVFELRPLLRDLRSMFVQEAMRQGLRLEVAIAGDVPQWVLADEGRLRQVLLNLVGNALKFTPAGGVTIGVNRRGDDLRFSVTDTGIGIPADKQALIFDAFRQADNSTSRRHGGTGLGLTISKRLVESMGGELSLESAPGEGSTFTFTVHAPAATPPAPQSCPPNELPARPMHILVAEDNRVNQHLILALLKKLGHSAEVAWNGLEALDALSHGPFDLVLMDIQMPELDGLQATRRIREHELGRSEHLPIVALTARAMPGDRELFLRSGMDDYLEKPIQEQRFHAVLNRMSTLVRPQVESVHGTGSAPG
jgi:signal transduction histidine kinase/streptogramin lyase/ActR/RegA family two-component response regulator